MSVPRTPPDSPDVHPAEAPLEDPDDGAAEPDELPDPELVPG
ncbi:MAG: hypothetical protein ACRDZ1_19400 [Acidimicrobiia bacterium]